MANVLSRTKINQIEANFIENMLAYKPKYLAVGKELRGEPGTVKVGKNAVGAIAATLADTATSATTSDMHSFEASFSSLQRYVKHTVPAHTLKNQEGMVKVAAELSQIAGKNIDREFFSMIEGLWAAAHPRAGNTAGLVGAGKKAIDTGLKGLIGEGGEFTYDTLLATAAMSETTINALVQLLLKQRDDRGLQLSLATTGKLVVLCAAQNAQIAHEVTKSALSGADNASNFHAPMFGGGITTWEFADPDDYLVIDADNTPFGYYLAESPTVDVKESDDGLFVHFVIKYNGVPVYDPYLYGVVGCNVA